MVIVKRGGNTVGCLLPLRFNEKFHASASVNRTFIAERPEGVVVAMLPPEVHYRIGTPPCPIHTFIHTYTFHNHTLRQMLDAGSAAEKLKWMRCTQFPCSYLTGWSKTILEVHSISLYHYNKITILNNYSQIKLIDYFLNLLKYLFSRLTKIKRMTSLDQ